MMNGFPRFSGVLYENVKNGRGDGAHPNVCKNLEIMTNVCPAMILYGDSVQTNYFVRKFECIYHRQTGSSVYLPRGLSQGSNVSRGFHRQSKSLPDSIIFPDLDDTTWRGSGA